VINEKSSQKEKGGQVETDSKKKLTSMRKGHGKRRGAKTRLYKSLPAQGADNK